MSRIHCVACGTSVVVDPQGICPEGHHVGSRGARVEAAMGSAISHPEEPEPWVYMIEELAEVGAGTNGHAATPRRQLRPLGRSGLHEGFDDEPADADALLRELHSLAALDESTAAPRPREQAPMPVEAAPPPPPPTPPATRPARLDRDAMTDAFAELSALDAFAREQGGARPATNGNGAARNGTRAGTGRPTGGTNGARPPSAPAEPATVDGPSVEGTLPDPDELAALFSSELGARPHPPEAAPAPAVDGHEPVPASDQLDELFAAAVTPPTLRPRDRTGDSQATAPGSSRVQTAPADPSASGALTPAPGTDPAAVPPPIAATTQAPADATAPAASATATLDLTSFTAKGGAGRKGGRKRLFGR